MYRAAMILFLVLLVGLMSVHGQTSVPIHVTIVMHIEQGTRYDLNPALFEQSRTNLFRFASVLALRGVKFNFQSDWTFLAAVTNYDRTGHAETGGTNIVAWMKYVLGFEIDPHNHVNESVFNYADVAALIHQCGMEPSGVAGGFIALPATNSEWGLFQQPITGAVYTSYVWTPSTLWGGGTLSHINETSLWFSGVYCPKDGTNFWMHDNGQLPCVGKYTGKDLNWTNLDILMALRSEGRLCTDRIYTCNIMTGMGDLLTPGYIASFSTQLQAYTNHPNLRWVGLSEITNIWAADYASKPGYLPFSMTNDVDSDGMIDGWEVTNFCGILDADGYGDADGDAETERQEFTADTSPTNAADFFRVAELEFQIISWPASAGRTYVVESAPDTESWSAIYTNAGIGPLMSYTNAADSTSLFFRVRVSL